MKKLSVKSAAPGKLVAGLSFAAMCALPGVAQADALAQSILHVTDFKLTASGSIASGTASGLGTVSGKLNGVDLVNVNAPGTTYSGTTSAGVGYAVDTPITGALSSTFAGGTTSVSGTAVTNSPFFGTGADALADAVVSLVPQGSGNVETNTGTTFSYEFALLSDSQISIVFDAHQFLRAYLAGTPILGGTSTANTNWSITIQKAGVGQVFNWAPNGESGGITGGTETLDPFSLNTGVTATANFINEATIINGTDALPGSFAAVTNFLGSGLYTMTINHKVDTRANIEVPEPATLALGGLSLGGLAGLGSRRAKRQAA